MSAGGPNSVAISRQSARYVVALGLVLLSVTVVGAALGGVTAAESQSSPVEVSDWTDLDDIRNDLDADYMLVNDLNETTPGYETVAGPNANGGKGFDPISGFNGSFDGQGNTINQLTIDRPNEDQVGLFGDTSRDAVIDEVILTNTTVTGSRYVGGLVGFNDEGTASTSSASATVNGSARVGGLVGLNLDGTVSNSSASGNVTGSDPGVGGLVGQNSGTVSNSSASAAVNSSSYSVGGLVGFNFQGMVSNSSASAAVTGYSGVGGLVGDNEGTVSNSSASGPVDGSDFRIGGLVGGNEGTVSNSLASGPVDGSFNVGGLVGDNDGGTVSNASASGAVTGSEEVGGLVGTNSGTVSDSLASGVVNGTGEFGPVGGLVGDNFETVTGAYWDIQATGQSQSAGGIGLNTSQMQGASAAQNMGALDFTNTWRVVTNPPGYPELRSLPDGPDTDPPLTAAFNLTPEDPAVGEQLTFDAAPSTPESDIESYNWTLGDGTTATGKQVTHTYTDSGQFTVELTVQNGTETDTTTETVSVSPASSSVEISDWTDLDDIRNDVDADYVLVNDLNETTPGYETVAGPNANGGKGFDPIGGFNASFDGQGNRIANLTIDRPSENEVGLFRDTSGGAVIEEMILTGATVTGSDDVGGLVGSNSGTVSTSSVDGAVTGSTDVGGLVGLNDGTVSNSSTSGNVDGSDYVGGLVGYNNDGGGTVSESFATGAVTGSSDVGGLVGENFGTVTGAYWDTQATGQSQSAGGIGLNTSQMQGASAAQNMGALNFNNTWEVVTNPPGYPELRSLSDGPGPPLTAVFNVTPEDPTAGEQLTLNADPSTPESDIESYNWTLGDGTTATGKQITHTYTDSGQFTVELTVQDGTETDTATEIVNVSAPSSSVEISDWSDLDDIRNDTDADYVLVNNLNETTPGYDTVAGPNANGGKGFAPIGGFPDGFSGSFDGQGNSIEDLIIDRPNKDDVGLFGYTSGGAVIEEVILTNDTVTGSEDVGGLVGESTGGTVSNSSASGVVNGTGEFGFVGGLVGENTGATVSNSSASATVTGFEDVGGLVGYNEGTVSNSSASATVTGSGDGPDVGGDFGGLVGYNDLGGTVSNSSASGAVTGSSRVGGLVGFNSEGTVSESFATGAVTGSSDVGGLVGLLGNSLLDPEEEAILRNSYYDTQTTEQQAAVGKIIEGDGTAELRGEVAGLPTSQMQGTIAAQNMDTLDFTNTWRVVTNPPGYPELRSLPDGPGTEPPLTAGFTITPEDPIVGEQLTFDADPSTPESDIENYDWTLGDGTTATGKQVTHTYTDSGQFTVELTVQDGTETDTATKTVSVSPPADTFGIKSITPYVGGTAVEEYTHVEDLNTSLSYRVRVTQPSVTANATFELGSTTYTDTDGSDGWQFPVPTAQLTSDETLLVTAYRTDGTSAVDAISVPVVETPAWFDLLNPISRFEDKPIIELQAEFPSGGGSPIQLPNQFPFAGDVSLPVVGSSQSSDLTATVTVRVNLRTAEATVTVGGAADYSLSNRIDLSGGVSGSASLNLYEMDIRGGTLDAEVGAEITFPGIPSPPVPPVVPPGVVNLYPIFGIEAAAEAQFDEVDSVNGTNPVGFELTEGSITPELYARQELGQKLPVAELVFGIEEGVNTTIPYPSFEPINGSAFAEVYLRAAAAGLEASVSFPPGEDRFSYQFGPLGGDTVSAPNLTETSLRANTPTVEWQPVDRTGSTPPDRQFSAASAATARDGPTPVVATDAVAGNRITDNTVADKTPALAQLGTGESTLLWSQQQPNLSVLNGREILASTSTNETSFGTPVALTNDTVSDYYPTITPTGGTTSEAVAAFTTFDRTFNESNVTNPGDIYPHGEIRIARLTETGWQSPTFLTNNTAFDFRPTVASRGDNWTIAWTRDGDGNLSTWSDRAVVYVRYNESGPVGPVRSVEQARSPRLTTVDGTTRLTYLDMASNATSGQLVIGSLQPGQSAPVEQASYSVSNLTDLTAANDTIVWTTTSGEPWAQVADTDGVRNLSAPTGLTPPQSVTLSSRPGRLLLNFRAARPDSSVAEAYYRPRVDGVWQSSRRYASGADANLTYWQATTAGTENGFTSVVAGKELDTAQKDDLFVFQSQFRPDLAVTVQNRSKNVTVGDEATLTVIVNNSGDIATNATTVTATNSSGTVAAASVPALQPGSSVERSLTGVLDNSGQLRVTVDPNGTVQEHSEANNQETVRFQPPDLTVINRTVTRLNGTIRVNATLGNPSSITAPAVTYRFESGPTQNRSGSVGALAPGATTQVSATFDASALSPRFPLTIRVDPTDSLTESNERNNTLVGPVKEPEIAVSAKQITYARQNGTIVATVPIENTGTGGGEGTLQVTGADSETVIATQSFEVGPAVRTASSVVNSTQVALPGVTRNETVIFNASARPQGNGSSAVVDRVTTTDTLPSVAPPALSGSEGPPQDVDGDARYEDVDGDGEFTIFDVQAFFVNFNGQTVQNNPAPFNFDESAGINIFDVQALFTELS